MNHPLETFTFSSYTVEIHPDHDAENPRTWCSSTLCTRHRRRTFGGEMLPNAPATIEEAFAEHLADRGLTGRDVIWLPVYSIGSFYGSDHEASGLLSAARSESPPPVPKSAMPSNINAGRITRASNG